jgi:hypothetical protein
MLEHIANKMVFIKKRSEYALSSILWHLKMEVYQRAQIPLWSISYTVRTLFQKSYLEISPRVRTQCWCFLWPLACPREQGKMLETKTDCSVIDSGKGSSGSVQAGQHMMDRDGKPKCSVTSDSNRNRANVSLYRFPSCQYSSPAVVMKIISAHHRPGTIIIWPYSSHRSGWKH